jgi:hypothetical protein
MDSCSENVDSDELMEWLREIDQRLAKMYRPAPERLACRDEM